MRHKEFWFALTVGALAGAVSALLYAPRSGASTRRKIRRGMAELGDTLEEKAEYLKCQAENLGRQAQKLMDYSKGEIDTAAEQMPAASSLGSRAMRAVTRMM